ncbi:MAG TPA: hypothetical protein PLL69_02190 [Gemmatimonadales bacterium]|nr:hypothetical protein [Gemmatimonadales bacterium]
MIWHRTAMLTAAVTMLVGCGEPFPDQLLDAVTKGGRVSRAMIHREVEEYSQGQPLLGPSGTTGGRGKIAADVRISASERRFPDINSSSVAIHSQPDEPMSSTSERTITTSANAAFGLVRGMETGTGRYLAVDLLLSVVLRSPIAGIGNDAGSMFGRISPATGLRVGIVEESRMLPDITVSLERRMVPRQSYRWTEIASDESREVTMHGNTSGSMTGWRVVAGRKFGNFALSGGYGRDSYKLTSNDSASIAGIGSDGLNQGSPEGGIGQLFGSLSYRLGGYTLFGEARHQAMGDDHPGFSSGTDNPKSRTWFTIGIGVGGTR